MQFSERQRFTFRKELLSATERIAVVIPAFFYTFLCGSERQNGKPGSAKFLRGSSPMTQPLWARKWHDFSGWFISSKSCSKVASSNGKVKYLHIDKTVLYITANIANKLDYTKKYDAKTSTEADGMNCAT